MSTSTSGKQLDDSLPSTGPGTPNPEIANDTHTDIEKSAPAASLAAPGPGPPPDGGLQAWLVVLGGFCIVFASFGWINCMYIPHGFARGFEPNIAPGIGVFQDYYQSHQLASYSSSTVAWIPATESFFMFFCVRIPHTNSQFRVHQEEELLLTSTSGSCDRHHERHVWPACSHRHRILPARLRLDDDVHLARVLSILPCAKRR